MNFADVSVNSQPIFMKFYTQYFLFMSWLSQKFREVLVSKSEFRGLVKLKKSKNPRKTRIGQTQSTHPPTYPIFNFFWNNWKHENYTKKHKIYNNKKSELGLDPPTHFRIFLVFLDCFQLDKTP